MKLPTIVWLSGLVLTTPVILCVAEVPPIKKAYLVQSVESKSAKRWTEVTKGSEFCLFPSGTLAGIQTEFQALSDPDGLHLRVVCHEPSIGSLRTLCAKHDGPVWEDDSVEILVDPGKTEFRFFHFTVNARGCALEERKMDDGRISREWDGVWESHAAIDSQTWICEVKIPYQTLGVKPPQSGEVWGWNICRNRKAGTSELSSWTPVKRGFCVPMEFGFLVFGSFSPCLEAKLQEAEKAIARWQPRARQSLGGADTAPANQYRNQFRDLEARRQQIVKDVQQGMVAPERFISIMEALAGLPDQYEELAIRLQMEQLLTTSSK